MFRRVRLNAEPETINRSAIVIQPQQPFLDWLHRADTTSEELVLESLRIEPTIYLLPETTSKDDADRLLQRCFDEIFTEQLNAWCRDTDTWPSKRTFKMFRQWFEWSYHSMIYDLSDEELIHDLD